MVDLERSSSPVPLKARSVRERCTLNLSRAQTSSRWCGVVVRRGGSNSGLSAALDYGLKLREHHWYQRSRPRGSLALSFNRQEQTLLARFRSNHVKTMKFSEGSKSFEMCTNCPSEPASPAHILECLGLTKQNLADHPLLVLDFLRAYEVMDLV
ncbi:uncharacterized protein TNCV_2925091 [Trichonephila clavipes]|nr:uncharacterized protein TNCV_2925091 [Trichonephila clavipes]